MMRVNGESPQRNEYETGKQKNMKQGTARILMFLKKRIPTPGGDKLPPTVNHFKSRACFPSRRSAKSAQAEHSLRSLYPNALISAVTVFFIYMPLIPKIQQIMSSISFNYLIKDSFALGE